MTEKEKIDNILTRGVKNIIPSRKKLEKLLKSEKKLNVYIGVDPTATHIHIGHAVALRKLQILQELGHKTRFLIGDFTALIGDTSDKEGERPILTKKEIQKNFKTYKKQAQKILDFSKVEVVFNSSWLKKLTFEDIVKLTQNFSVGDFVGRELIKKRLQAGKRVRLDETLYPIMQGYDSYFMDTDIQLGGADQTFNMQAGRTLQKNLRNKESFVLVNEYLTGTDGRKMSKSWGNAIWLDDSPRQVFGKTMSLNDELIQEYFLLATNIPESQIKKLVKKAKSNPLDVKKKLAYEITRGLHSEKQAKEAQKYFEETFQKGKLPEKVKTVTVKKEEMNIVDLLEKTGSGSRSQIKRLIKQGAVEVNQRKVDDPTADVKIKKDTIVKIGKKKFVKIETS